MGPSAAVAGGLPPLPPGAVLNSAAQQSNLPPLPPGAQLTSSPAAPPAHSNGLTDNPNGEGVYKMVDGEGANPVSVPYSKVSQAASQGHFFVDRPTLAQYARDHAADPMSEGRVDKYIDNLPWWDPAKMTVNLLKGAGTGALKTATAFDKPPRTQLEQQAQLGAETPGSGPAQAAGEGGENLGEFFTGEELLGLLGKGVGATGEAMGMADRLKSATNLAQMLDKHPIIAKLLKIGASAVKQGTLGGAQTYVKTGGDTEAAKSAAEWTAGGGAAIGAVGEGISQAAHAAAAPEATQAIEGVTLPKPTPKPPGEVQQAGAKAYGKVAGQAIRPHLEALNAAIDTPVFDIPTEMNRIGDYAASRDVLAANLNKFTDPIDQATGDRFSQLRQQITAAQHAAARDPKMATEYKSRLAEMDSLLTNIQGVKPELAQAVTRGWRQWYVLGDITRSLDKSLDGLPGQSAVSQEQRGLHGNQLLSSLKNVVATHGRSAVEDALGGPQRLKSLEAIGEATKTNAGRQQFNRGILNVVGYMIGAKAGWALTGNVEGGILGGAAGYKGAEAVKMATQKVMRAVQANPQVAQHLLFAIDSGAKPANYGPIIATLIQQHETQASREQKATQGDETQ